MLPYPVGLELGAVWKDEEASLQLGGNLAQIPAQPLLVVAQVAKFPPVKLAFVWSRSKDVPVILGQYNFFQEFDVCFYRSRLEFEINPKSK